MKSALLTAGLLLVSFLALAQAAESRSRHKIKRYALANAINNVPEFDKLLTIQRPADNSKVQRRSDDDDTVYGTFPVPTPEPEKPQVNQEPRPIVHMNKKQKDAFVQKVKKAGPAMKKRLLKFLLRQREDDIAELKERLGHHAEWPTAPAKPGQQGQHQ